MEFVKTGTGKTFGCDYFNPFPQAAQVNIRILGTPMREVVAVFSDPKETGTLICGQQVVRNYTKVIAVVPEGNAIRVVLGEE